MIYDKLHVIFLSVLASEKNHSTNSVIAEYILKNYDKIKNIGIQELALRCNVGTSSISRFCRDIGLRDFIELKELISSTSLNFQKISSIEEINDTYSNYICESIKSVSNSIDISKITKLCEDIKKYNNVAVFGLLKAGCAAISLQTDLLLQGKNVYTNIVYNQQMEYIMNSNEENLIIIFSYTGSYFEYTDLRVLSKKLKKPKVWFIGGNIIKNYDFINEYITFESKQTQLSHPYQLQYISGMISQLYATV